MSGTTTPIGYERPFAGYPGQVFATCYQAAAWLANLLASGAAPAANAAQGALACFQTFSNGADAVAMWTAANAFAQETINLANVQALPLNLDPVTQTYFTARVASMAAAASGLAVLPPAANPFNAIAYLGAGQPAIADTGYLEWCVGFLAETPPSGLTTATLTTYATGVATAWLTIANAVQVVQGVTLTNAYDAAARQFRVASTVASGLTALTVSGGFSQINTQALWNGTVAMPSLLLDAASLTSAPASIANQQAAVIRFKLRNLAIQTAYLLLSLRSPIIGNVMSATLRRNKSLMDLAARTVGSYEEWASIAALNAVQPPYPGPANQTLAASGTPLLLPGSVVPPSGSIPTYAANVLGIDYDFGPINGPQPAWLGDISLIAGYLNLRRALGRQLQTPLGTLIYHSDFGCRIPYEIGAVQSVNEADRLAAFGAAALASDPRTANVLSAVATVQPGRLATFSGTVIPVGPGAQPVGVNEVISPLP